MCQAGAKGTIFYLFYAKGKILYLFYRTFCINFLVFLWTPE